MPTGVGSGVSPALRRRRARIPYLLPVAGAILHLRSDVEITTVGADADMWQDNSGFGNHALPNAGAFNRPEYLAAGGVNGFPGVYFDRGGWEGMDISTISGTPGSGSGSYTTFAVYEQLNAHNDIQGLVGTDSAAGGDWFNPAITVSQTTDGLG